MGNNITKGVTKGVSKDIKHTRGGKLASVEANATGLSREELSRVIDDSYKWIKEPIVKTDEECAERIEKFFEKTIQNGELPTVEKMALSLGVTRKTLWEWENGSQGTIRAMIVQRAKEVLASIDAELVSRNKIPQVVYIFRAKNYHGMKDQQDVVTTIIDPLGDRKSNEEIVKRYDNAIPDMVDIVDDTP